MSYLGWKIWFDKSELASLKGYIWACEIGLVNPDCESELASLKDQIWAGKSGLANLD